MNKQRGGNDRDNCWCLVLRLFHLSQHRQVKTNSFFSAQITFSLFVSFYCQSSDILPYTCGDSYNGM